MNSRPHSRRLSHFDPSHYILTSLLPSLLFARHGDKKACHTPQFSSFPFIYLHTLSFSVSSKSFVCRSYENCRVSPQQFPLWNSALARPRTPFPMCFHLSLFLSYSCALFCIHENHNPFLFKRFRTLFAKHPGWGPVEHHLSCCGFARSPSPTPLRLREVCALCGLRVNSDSLFELSTFNFQLSTSPSATNDLLLAGGARLGVN